MKSKILIVDDEPLVLDLLSGTFLASRHEVFCANCGEQALEILERQKVDLVILDYSLPDLCGTKLFHQIRAGNPGIHVVFLTGHPNIETAVSLMKAGARDYLTKPFNMAELQAHISNILQDKDGRYRKDQSTSMVGARSPHEYLWGNSTAMKVIETQVRNLQRYPDTSVLITGPTGTGKSVVARRIHELTWGSHAPFVEIDCSTIPRELCESELFGHEKGSFTGAHCVKNGLFEAAGHGTAFLDEIGELDLPLQTKFLRVLEARHFKRVGGHTILPMQARIVAATNRSLPELVRSGHFREDLYFRLNVFELWMPALKERGDDVLLLAQYFLKHFTARYRKPIVAFAPDALDYLRNCDFPGNVRELRNMVERAVINSDGPTIEFPQLVTLPRPPWECAGQAATASPSLALESKTNPGLHSLPGTTTMNLADLEKQKLHEALAAAKGNKSKAAKLVGLSRTAFHRRLQKYENSETDSTEAGTLR